MIVKFIISFLPCKVKRAYDGFSRFLPHACYAIRAINCRETPVSLTSRNEPWAVPKLSESSHTETFSLSGCKTCAILARILGRAAPIHASGLLSLNIFKDRGLRATNLHSKFYFMRAIALNRYSLFLFNRLEIEKSADVTVCGFFIWK